MSQAHVQVVLGGQTLPRGLPGALRRLGARASFGPLSETLRLGLKPTATAVVVVAPEDADGGQESLQALLDQVAADPRATLVLRPAGHEPSPRPVSSSLPVSFSTYTDEQELADRLGRLLARRGPLEALPDDRAAADAALARRYRRQLHLAGQLQRDFLPRLLRRQGRLSFAALYRPADCVSGDIYDVRRINDDHVAVAVVDAQGHGICAALLTVFIKRALYGAGRRRVPRPDRVLRRLNAELLEASLSEFQFVAAAYAVVNQRTGRVELARAGLPYPILRQRGGRCRLVRPAGILLGVVSQPRFELTSFTLESGESLLIHSDGLEQVTRPAARAALGASCREGQTANAPPDRGGRCQDVESLAALRQTRTKPGEGYIAPDEEVTATEWYRQLEGDGVAAALERLAIRFEALRRLGQPLDDLTVLAVSRD